jgi:16S rRNA (guanine966-N2)-methyltransferase
VRVVASRFRGRRLGAPRGTATRPTSDRVREALFSILGPLEGARVLDLFAGSGALGIEALSRGAAFAHFADSDRRAVAVVRANLEALGVDPSEARARVQSARTALRNARTAAEKYDLVFLDPPYRAAPGMGRELGEALAGVLARGARIVTESDRRAPLELPFDLTHERRYGDTLIRIHDA